MPRKPSAESRTLDIFGAAAMAPVFGHRGIPSFAPAVESMPLFANPNPGPAKRLPSKALEKAKRLAKAKKKRIGKNAVGRDAVKRLVAENARLEQELAKCQNRPARSRKAARGRKEPQTLPEKLAEVVAVAAPAMEPENAELLRRAAEGDGNERVLGQLTKAIAEEPSRIGQNALRAVERKMQLDVHGFRMGESSRAEVAQDAEMRAQLVMDDAPLVARRQTSKRTNKKKPLGKGRVGRQAALRMAAELADMKNRLAKCEAKVSQDEQIDASSAETDARPNKYEQKRAARAVRLRKRADKLRTEAGALEAHSQRMAGVMAGTPILVGHHSQRRHERDLEKMHDRTRRSIKNVEQAKRLERRAQIAESGNGAISSDDPDAVKKLREKLAGMEREFPALKGYQRTNARQELVRIRKRIEDIEARAKKAGQEVTINGTRIVWNGDENRVQIHFAEKPSEAIRKELKSHGFKWAPSQDAWQRIATENAWYYANSIVKGVQSE